MGDVVVAMPYLQDLRNKLPNDVTLDLLIREETESIPKHLSIFNTVYSIKGGRNTKWQLFYFLLMYPKLLFKGYHVLLDLQNHNLSRVIRFLLGIKYFSVFDRTSGNFGGDRYKNTINAVGLAQVEFTPLTAFKNLNEKALFERLGLNSNTEYIVINPAGAFETRNWNLDNYVSFCELCFEKNKNIKVLVLGIEKIKNKAQYFKNKLGDHVIDLVGQTTPVEAMAILRMVKLMVSEDSGLLHMAWCVGTPSIGILGSTRNDWTNPKLPHTYFFNSSDLPCGDCMLEKCRFSEIKCLTRIKPEDVLREAEKLVNLTIR